MLGGDVIIGSVVEGTYEVEEDRPVVRGMPGETAGELEAEGIRYLGEDDDEDDDGYGGKYEELE